MLLPVSGADRNEAAFATLVFITQAVDVAFLRFGVRFPAGLPIEAPLRAFKGPERHLCDAVCKQIICGLVCG
ncbi:hypothetical protein JM93_03047 [Roseibium hamelinense]|uniref:Uncharacterized protein n=1 Tax=Roseibium hamelinense TaxID=150831 RepID=A0A562SU03_9HYPH|nr:hypothetical protein JM93_03047 [Roseibium hamelinense]